LETKVKASQDGEVEEVEGDDEGDDDVIDEG